MKISQWAAAALFLAMPASAERLRAYWHLEPITQVPATAEFDSPFLNLKLRPLHVVKLLPSGTSTGGSTMLMLVFDARGRAAYCSRPDDSAAARNNALISGLLNKTPCFLDNDNDGAFDAVFSVFYAPEAVRTPHGSIDSAIPLPQPIKYSVANTYDFLDNYVRTLRFHGSRELGKAIIQVGANGHAFGIYPPIRAEKADPATYRVYNNRLRVTGIAGNVVAFTFEPHPSMVAYVEYENMITFGPLPDYVQNYLVTHPGT